LVPLLLLALILLKNLQQQIQPTKNRIHRILIEVRPCLETALKIKKGYIHNKIVFITLNEYFKFYIAESWLPKDKVLAAE
jgi:hypothetical protein